MASNTFRKQQIPEPGDIPGVKAINIQLRRHGYYLHRKGRKWTLHEVDPDDTRSGAWIPFKSVADAIVWMSERPKYGIPAHWTEMANRERTEKYSRVVSLPAPPSPAPKAVAAPPQVVYRTVDRWMPVAVAFLSGTYVGFWMLHFARIYGF